MIVTCNEAYTDAEIIGNCRSVDDDDIYGSLPVTDSFGLTFRNVFCALCNFRDVEDLLVWMFDFTCASSEVNTFIANTSDVLQFLKSTCDLEYRPSRSFSRFDENPLSSVISRSCFNVENIIDEFSCSESHPAYDYCAEYTAYIQTNNATHITFFKNPHCLLCYYNLQSFNESDFGELNCDFWNFPGYGDEWSMLHLSVGKWFFYALPISVLLNFGSLTRLQIVHNHEITTHVEVTECPVGQTYDPFQSRCRRLSCPDGTTLKGNKCVFISHANITCGDSEGHLNMSISVTYRDNVKIASEFAMCFEEFKYLDGVTYHGIENKTLNNKTLQFLATASISVTHFQALEAALDSRFEGVTTLEEGIPCKMSEIQIDVACMSGGVPYSCFQDDRTSNLARNLTWHTVESFQDVNSTTQLGDLQIRYTQKGSSYEKFTSCTNRRHHSHLSCPLISLNRTAFTRVLHHPDWLIFTPTGVILRSDECEVTSKDQIQICADHISRINTSSGTPPGKSQVVFYSPTQEVVGNFCTSISLISCTITFFTICFFKSLRNRVTPLLMNFVTALFLAEFILITGGHQTHNAQICATVAMLLHYFWLSSFSWMNILGFDLFLTFGFADTLNAPKEMEKKYILLCLAYGWGIPLTVVLPTLVLHLCQCTDVYIRYGGEEACWISNGWANLILFFGVPIALMVATNTFLYIGIVWGIWKARYENKKQRAAAAGGGNHGNNDDAAQRKARLRCAFKYLIVYIKISILMGFTWIFGYIATFTGVEALWYVFIILNSSQGFFVFLANTCNKRVYKCYKEALCGRGNRVRPQIPPPQPAQQRQNLRPRLAIEQESKSLVAEAINEGNERARSGIKESDYQAARRTSDNGDKPSTSGQSVGEFFSQNLGERSDAFTGRGDTTKKTTSSSL